MNVFNLSQWPLIFYCNLADYRILALVHALTSRHNFRRFEGLVPVYISCLCHHSALQLRFSWQFKYLKSQPCLPERSLPRRISPKGKGEKGKVHFVICRGQLIPVSRSDQTIRSVWVVQIFVMSFKLFKIQMSCRGVASLRNADRVSLPETKHISSRGSETRSALRRLGRSQPQTSGGSI